MEINKQSGLPLQIYIPNIQTLQPFEFEFYTNSTAPKTANIVVAYDGTTYTDCAPWEKGVYLYTDKKLPSTGDLLCRATYYVPTPAVAGGLQKVVIDNISTDITIVTQGGSYFDPILDPSKLKIPSFNDNSCSHLPLFMTFYPGAEKGDQGIQGIQGVQGPAATIDYSILTEQLIPGEFFVGRNGTRKQVYTRTFVTDSVVRSTQYGTYADGFRMPNVEAIINAIGTISYRKNNTLITVPIDRPIVVDITDNAVTQIIPDFECYEVEPMSCNILVVGKNRANWVGTRLQMTAAVKYIKQ